MNNKRAKLLRRMVKTLGHSPTPRYDEVRFTRKFDYLKRMPNGTHQLTQGEYPVRTLFLVKCQRAVYRRLKRKSFREQNQIINTIRGLL